MITKKSRKPLRICILSLSWPPKCGGSGFYAFELAESLRKHGHDITIYTNRSSSQKKKNWEIVHVDSRSPHIFSYNVNLRKHESTITARAFDIILHNEIAGVFLSKQFFARNHNVMALHHQTDKEYALTLSRKMRLKLVQILQDRMVNKSDGLSFLAEKARSEAISKYKLVKPTFIIPCIVTLPSSKKQSSANNEYVNIFYPSGAGGNYERKGFVELIPVLDKLSRQGLKFHVTVSGGNDKVIKILQDQAEKYNLGDSITFTPNLTFEQIMDVYKSADIIVFTSRYEGFGRPIIEGLANAKPVITFDVGIASEVIETGVNGFIANDYEEVHDTLNDLITNKKMRKDIGSAAGRINLSRFDEAAIVNAFEEMVETLR